MKRKVLLSLLALVIVVSLTGCGKKETEKGNQDINGYQREAVKESENKEKDTLIVDDEIIDIDDDYDSSSQPENVNVEKVINCEGCVFAYIEKEAKKLGGTIASNEYTNDVTQLKTKGGIQRHNFFGLVLSGDTISKAYACILKDNKIYCIQGSTDGAYFTSNVGILNQIFKSDECRTISDGNTYTCTDHSYNGDTKKSGYTSMHYETSCTIYGKNARTGELICH